jgi:Ran GTPase-activating protein (RanGAP) involved in mRNA processing and transport
MLVSTPKGHPNLEKMTFIDVVAPDVEDAIDMLVEILFVSVPKLSSLRVVNTKISPTSASAVAYSTSLRMLTLSNSGFTDKDVMAVASGLAKCPSLVSVDLRGNGFSDVGCMAASSILQKSTSLATILLDGEGLVGDDTSLGRDPAKAVMGRSSPRAA